MTPVDIGELRSLRNELLEAHRELNRLRVQNEQLVSTNRDLSVQLGSATQSGGELLRTIVALRQLLEARDVTATVASIVNVLVNIVGTEDFAVLTMTDGPRMRTVAGMGPALAAARSIPPTYQSLLEAPARVIPLTIDAHVVGAILIASLLPHREGFSMADEQVLGLLSSFAATAIASAQHRASWTRLHLAEVA